MVKRQQTEDDMLQDGQVGRLRMTMRDSADWQDAAARFFDREVRVTDSNGDTIGLHQPGFRVFHQDAEFADRARQAKATAYRDYDDSVTNAWRTPTGAGSVDPRGQEVGDLCTINGAPGHMRMINGVLTCVADPSQSARRSDGMIRDERAAAYADYDTWIASQWRMR